MVRLVLQLALAAGIGYALVCALAYLFQTRLVYFPGPKPDLTPLSIGLPYEEVMVTTEDGERIHGWYLPVEAPRGAALVAHGNAGNIAGRLPLADALRSTGLAVLLFDYRGYGESTGRPDEAGTYRDGEAMLAWLRNRHDRVVLYGESLGGGVATELAMRHDAAALILDSTFTSLPDVGALAYPYLPVRLLSRIRYDNRNKISKIDMPVLFIHSEDDETVPIEHGMALFEAATGDKEFLRTSGPHTGGSFMARTEWREQVRSFVHRATDVRRLP